MILHNFYVKKITSYGSFLSILLIQALLPCPLSYLPYTLENFLEKPKKFLGMGLNLTHY